MKALDSLLVLLMVGFGMSVAPESARAADVVSRECSVANIKWRGDHSINDLQSRIISAQSFRASLKVAISAKQATEGDRFNLRRVERKILRLAKEYVALNNVQVDCMCANPAYAMCEGSKYTEQSALDWLAPGLTAPVVENLPSPTPVPVPAPAP